MKKLLLMGILVMVLCIGLLISPETAEAAWIYDLTGFRSPHDQAFNDCIDDLTTPYLICQYMASYFDHNLHVQAYSPYEQWLYEDGDCNDYSTFAIFMARMHYYTTYQIYVRYTTGSWAHMLGVYVDGGYDYSSNEYFYNLNFSSFAEIVQDHDDRVTKTVAWYIVYDYDLNVVQKSKSDAVVDMPPGK